MKNFLLILFAVLSASLCVSQTFPFTGNLYYVNGVAGQNQKLISVGGYPSSFSTTVVCNISGNNYYNCLAANPIDGYIYYKGNMNGDVYRMDASGNNTLVASGVLGTCVSASFDNYGRLIFSIGNVVYYYNVNSNSIVKTFNLPTNCRDIIFNPKNCSVYCLNTVVLNQKPTLYQLDSNGTVLSSQLCSAYFPNNGLAYGKDGRLYGIDGGADLWSLNFANANVSFLTNSLTPPNVGIPHVDMCSFIKKTVVVTSSANVTNGCAPLAVNFSGMGIADSIISYHWDFGDGNTSTQQNPSYTYSTVGNYTVTLTLNNFSHFDGNCGIPVPNTSTFTIKVNPGSPLTITNIINVDCHGNPSGSALAVASGTASPFTYTWSSGQNIAQATSLSAGIYTVAVLNAGGCITTKTVQITEPTLLNASIQTPTSLCLGQSTLLTSNFSGGVTPYTLQWLHDGATTQNTNLAPVDQGLIYSAFIITDANNCKVSIPFTVAVYSYPTMTITPSHSICEGQYTQLNAGGANSYFWSTGTWGAINDVKPLATTSYTVIGTNGNCSSSAITNVFVHKAPSIQITDVPNNGCAPLMINMNSTSNSSITNYNWSINDKLADQNPNFSKHTFTEAGIYTVALQVTDNKGCSNQTRVSFEAYAKPKAQFSIGGEMKNGEFDVYEPTVKFTDESTDNINNWYWYFGDGALSLQKDPDHTYRDEAAVYKAFLVVQNTHGCADTTHKEVKISESPVIYVPNSFTPNLDGLNDKFTAKGIQVSEFRMRIFDRWGEKLFETNDMANGWDGTFKGADLKDDNYTWIIDYSTTKSKGKTITGQVTLYK